MKITITFDVPDGTTYRIGGVEASAEAQYVPPFEDELIPLPDGAMPVPGDIQTPLPPAGPFRGMTSNPGPSVCPVHHTPWKTVPAGVSKRTGKTYTAFSVCSTQGCDQRPQ